MSAVEWVHRSTLSPNDYNPNAVAPPELELLIISILEDGWTQPIVALPDGVIVDGFHRFMVSEDPRLVERYEGMVPVVRVAIDPVHRKMSTIRHNRARGTHGVVPMAKIVSGMLKDGCKPAEVAKRLQMEAEEIERLTDRAGSPERVSRTLDGFGKAWIPDSK